MNVSHRKNTTEYQVAFKNAGAKSTEGKEDDLREKIRKLKMSYKNMRKEVDLG
jgi:hypothetical protein